MGQVIDTFDVLADHLGCGCGCTPYQVGRALYRYTDCGPWTSFVTALAPRRLEAYQIVLFRANGRFLADQRHQAIPHEIFECFGLDRLGGPIEGRSPHLKVFIRTTKKLLEKRHGQIYAFRKEWDATLHTRKCPSDPEAWIDVRHVLEAVTHDVPYQCKLANLRHEVPNVLGIKIGSIVEGSDVDVGPQTLLFPFDSDELDATVKDINDEASFYWERDNSDWFTLRSSHGKDYPFRCTQFESEPVFLGDKPRSKKILGLMKKFSQEHYPGIWRKNSEISGAYERCIPVDEFVQFFDTNWLVKEWVNDAIYD